MIDVKDYVFDKNNNSLQFDFKKVNSLFNMEKENKLNIFIIMQEFTEGKQIYIKKYI